MRSLEGTLQRQARQWAEELRTSDERTIKLKQELEHVKKIMSLNEQQIQEKE